MPWNPFTDPLPDYLRYVEDFEAWIKDNPPTPPSPERLALDERRLAAIAQMKSEVTPSD